MRRQWVALILLAVAVILGAFAASRACGDDDDDGSDPVADGSGTPIPDVITEATSEREDIVLTLEVDEQTYDAGEEIEAKAVVKNNRGTPITYAPVTPGQAAFRMEAISLVPLGSAALDPVGDVPPVEGTLGPGEELELTAVWDQLLDIPNTPVQAPPGRYSIRATFIASTEEGVEPVDVVVAVTFRIEGSDPVLTPLDVLGRAVQSSELKSWMEGRAPGQNVICASPSTGLFYQGFMTNETVAETFDFLYTSQVDGGLPICGIVTDGDAWRLNFLNQAGPEPKRFNMLFDLNDGTLIRTEEPTPAPVETPTPSP